MVEAISANTTAHLENVEGKEPRPIGNPTEGALLLWVEEQGTDYLMLREAFRLEQRLPFDTNRIGEVVGVLRCTASA